MAVHAPPEVPAVSTTEKRSKLRFSTDGQPEAKASTEPVTIPPRVKHKTMDLARVVVDGKPILPGDIAPAGARAAAGAPALGDNQVELPAGLPANKLQEVVFDAGLAAAFEEQIRAGHDPSQGYGTPGARRARDIPTGPRLGKAAGLPELKGEIVDASAEETVPDRAPMRPAGEPVAEDHVVGPWAKPPAMGATPGALSEGSGGGPALGAAQTSATPSVVTAVAATANGETPIAATPVAAALGPRSITVPAPGAHAAAIAPNDPADSAQTPLRGIGPSVVVAPKQATAGAATPSATAPNAAAPKGVATSEAQPAHLAAGAGAMAASTGASTASATTDAVEREAANAGSVAADGALRPSAPPDSSPPGAASPWAKPAKPSTQPTPVELPLSYVPPRDTVDATDVRPRNKKRSSDPHATLEMSAPASEKKSHLSAIVLIGAGAIVGLGMVVVLFGGESSTDSTLESDRAGASVSTPERASTGPATAPEGTTAGSPAAVKEGSDPSAEPGPSEASAPETTAKSPTSTAPEAGATEAASPPSKPAAPPSTPKAPPPSTAKAPGSPGAEPGPKPTPPSPPSPPKPPGGKLPGGETPVF